MPSGVLADVDGGGVRPVDTESSTHSAEFPVRAQLANPDGQLRPGMTPYLRVLTANASLAERLLRRPLRAIRLFWWRVTA
jgi:multidrug efflux pump subunit AcrA (membrane-fusion protein)